MRLRTVCTAGLGAAALVLSTMSVGTATAAGASGASDSPSGVSATVGVAGAAAGAAIASAAPDGRAKCQTAFGTPAENGIISNAGSLESSGAADFKCGRDENRRGRTFKTVIVQGYFGDAGSTDFNVTVRKNAGGEPSDTDTPICATTGVGTPTGAQFPEFDTTRITLDSKCIAKKGTNWLEVQAVTENAWYWRVQSDIGAKFPADWKEAGAFGTGCITYENGLTMEDCIFGGPAGTPDFVFKLK